MKRQVGLITCQNPTHIDHHNRGVKLLQFPDVFRSIDIQHVDLTQIGLNLAPGIIFPPMFPANHIEPL